MEKSIYTDGYCHKVHGREILRIPDDNVPLVHYHVYAQIDEEGKCYITPSGIVCLNYPGYIIDPKVDNEGYYFVYVHGQRRRIKDIIEEVFNPVPDNPPETYRVV